MAKRNNTALIIGGVVLAGVAVYMLTKKTTTTSATTPAALAPTAPGTSSLVAQGSSLVTSLINLFKSSSPPAYTPVGLAATSTPPPGQITAAPPPGQGLNLLNYLNPSADTAYTPDTSGFTDIYSI